MTIQEAIKSGHPFKRERWKNWYVTDKFGENIVMVGGAFFSEIELDVDDILADDWTFNLEKQERKS